MFNTNKRIVATWILCPLQDLPSLLLKISVTFSCHIRRHHHHHHHYHHLSAMKLGHLLTRFGLTFPEIPSKVCHDSFCQSGSSVSLPWVIYCNAFYLHVVSSFSCIPVICPKFVLFLTPLQFVYLFCNLSKCILQLFSCISSLLLLFFWRPLH